jgi:hypothetical protein
VGGWRRWPVLAAAAAAVAALTVWLVPARPVDAAASTQWGIDSCSTAQSVVPATQQSMGDPQFMARYLTNY